MELAPLIAALSQPRAYPDPVDVVEVRQTHISVALLAGRWVYKIKKPLRLSFLDYSTLERRRRFCAEEVRLNRRLAPAVYIGVVAVAESDGAVRVEGQGEVVEWAVKMVRLSAEATLRAGLERGEVGPDRLAEVARHLAAFHARAERSAAISESGRFAAVARNARENFTEAADQVGTTASRAVFERLRMLTEAALGRLHDTIEARAARGVPCDTHGDLRLDHVYLLLRDAGAAREIVIIDCIEFNERFRHADPVADMAFLVMDLEAAGHHGLASAFADAYFQASGDFDGRDLLPFYTAYRAAVRGKVEGLKSAAPEVAADDRTRAGQKSRARWLLALGALEAAPQRPCLLLVGGLPGTGKSTLAGGLAERAGFTVIRSDPVRKELAGIPAATAASGPSAFGQGIYTPEWTDRTYAECLRRAEAELFEGGRVLVDASFAAEVRRRRFLDAAREWGVPGILLVCQADEADVEKRLRERKDDASDADWSIYQQALAEWEPLGPATQTQAQVIVTNDGPDAAEEQALEALRARGLW
jgi:aminoglycoside phosphotransferase family enzyme/predicted kinase